MLYYCVQPRLLISFPFILATAVVHLKRNLLLWWCFVDRFAHFLRSGCFDPSCPYFLNFPGSRFTISSYKSPIIMMYLKQLNLGFEFSYDIKWRITAMRWDKLGIFADILNTKGKIQIDKSLFSFQFQLETLYIWYDIIHFGIFIIKNVLVL